MNTPASTPALSTSGLNKRFGSLVVANEIGIALPQGVRYALIGPNGAGKTTLINLMTGMLRPDGGHILLGGEDITALSPEQRVGRGLVRTFQINSLFPHLNPLEAVTLAVCEREKISRTFWRTTADYRAAVDEAYDILKSLLLAPVCTRETRELAYGQQRLLEIALALGDQAQGAAARRAGRGRAARREHRAVHRHQQPVEGHHRAVHRARHGAGVPAGEPHHRHGRAAASCWRARPTKSPPIRACARSISEARMAEPKSAEPLLAFKNVRSGYGEAVVLDDVSFEVAERGSLAVLGRNGVGKSTLLLTLMGFTQLRRGTIVWRGKDISRMAPHRRAQSGIGWVAQEREIFANLTVEENLTVASRPGRWDLDAAFEFFPRLKERRLSRGNQLSGGEQQMLATARALMTNPALLLLDEPLEGLAPIIVEELVRGLRKMIVEEGTAVILVEQHAEIALSLTEHAVLLERGAIVHRARSQDLLKDHATLDRYIGLRVAEAKA